jgi:hypothetical protein
MVDEAKREKMIRQVKALWATADHPNTPPHEADTARNMAADLMAKYQIDEIVLSASGNIVDDIMFVEIRLDRTDRPLPVPEQRMALIGGIAMAFDCRGVIHTKKYDTADIKTGKVIPGGTFYECIGYRKDVDMVKFLYFSLVTDMLEAMMGEKVKTPSYQGSFALGYAERIATRLWDAHRRVSQIAEETSSSLALAIRDKKSQVSEWFDNKYPPSSLGKVRTKAMRFDSNAAQRGRNRADAADIGQGRMGSGNAGSLGKGE